MVLLVLMVLEEANYSIVFFIVLLIMQFKLILGQLFLTFMLKKENKASCDLE